MNVTNQRGNVRRNRYFIEMLQAFALGALVMLFMKSVAHQEPLNLRLLVECFFFGALFSGGWMAFHGVEAVFRAFPRSDG